MEDYELIDTGEGRRLEKFGQYLLDRPDPQIIWRKSLKDEWEKADAVFNRTETDKGEWTTRIKLPEKWILKYKNLKFWIKLTPFKHTGIFPEQAWEWDLIEEKVKAAKTQPNILNLFAYTGGATLAAAAAGAKVTHLDASRPAITWARENQEASGLTEKPIRWILDDAIKFTQREINRGVKYDGIIMDPPAYGHGPKGEKWNFNESLPTLLDNCSKILSDNPFFVIVNAYAISSSSMTLANILEGHLGKLGGEIKNGELTLKETSQERILSTGIYAYWAAV